MLPCYGWLRKNLDGISCRFWWSFDLYSVDGWRFLCCCCRVVEIGRRVIRETLQSPQTLPNVVTCFLSDKFKCLKRFVTLWPILFPIRWMSQAFCNVVTHLLPFKGIKHVVTLWPTCLLSKLSDIGSKFIVCTKDIYGNYVALVYQNKTVKTFISVVL